MKKQQPHNLIPVPHKSFMSVHRGSLVMFLAAALIAGGSMALTSFAAPPGTPYNPGETLAPSCAPGSANCTVVTPALSGVNADITQLTGLTTALSVAQGGTGITSISAGTLLGAQTANTIAAVSLSSKLQMSGLVLDVNESNFGYNTANFNTAADARITAKGDVSGGYPVLNGSLKIATSAIPTYPLGSFSQVANQAAREALTATAGDIAVQTDNGFAYLYVGPASTDWVQLTIPAGVTSVNGNSGVVVLTLADLTGTLPVNKGGTGLTAAPTNGQLLIGNGTDYTLSTLTAGANITITNSAGGITIAAAGGGGGSNTFDSGLTVTGIDVDWGGNLSQNAIITANGTEVVRFENTGTGNSLEVYDVAADTSPFIIDAAGNVNIGGYLETTGFAVAPAVSAAGSARIYYNTGDNKLYLSKNGAAYAELGAGGGGSTFIDNVFAIQDNGDATKQVAFQVSGVSAATTRTLTVPDRDGGLVLDTLADNVATALNMVEGANAYVVISTTNGTESITLGNTTTDQDIVLSTDGDITVSKFSTAGVLTNNASGNILSVASVPVTQGGTGLTTVAANSLLYASAADTIAALAPGTNTHVLTMVGGVPTWQAPAGGGITSLEGQTGATQTFTDDTNVTITSAANAHALGWTGQLSVARGGTGLAAIAADSLLVTNAANTLTVLTPVTTGHVLTYNGTDIVWAAPAGGFTGLTLAGDTGTQAIADTNTITIAGGKGLVSAAGATDTVTVDFDYTATLAADPTMAAGEAVFGTTGVVFEGGTADANEALINVAVLTADRTITLPDASGTVVLSGTIVNADVNASAAIALSKLAGVTANRLLVSDGSGVITPSAVTDTEAGYLSGVTSAIQTQLNSKIGGSITDNVTDALDIQQGANNYINIDTTDTTESVTVGNATTNPDFTVAGSGTITLGSLTGLIKGATGALSAATAGTDYIYPAGVTGGQSITGGTASGEDLTLLSTSNATKGHIYFGAGAGRSGYNSATHNLGVGTDTPGEKLAVVGDVSIQGTGGGKNIFVTNSAQAGNVTYTWPNGDAAAAGYVLSSDGAGGLSWSAIGSNAANRTLSNLTSPTAINEDLLPDANPTNLGSSANEWNRLFLAGDTAGSGGLTIERDADSDNIFLDFLVAHQAGLYINDDGVNSIKIGVGSGAQGLVLNGGNIATFRPDATGSAIVVVDAATGLSNNFIVTDTGNVTAAGTLAVNGDSITADGATLTVNAGGAVDIQDALTADSLTLDTGGITLSSGETITNGTNNTFTFATNAAGTPDSIALTMNTAGGASFTGTFSAADLTAARTWTLPDTTGTFLLDTTLATTAFIQNGNSFAGAAVLGTNDANSLSFETGGTTRATIAAGGDFTYIPGTDSATAFVIRNAANDTSVVSVNTSDSPAGAAFAVSTKVGDARIGAIAPTGSDAAIAMIADGGTYDTSFTLDGGSGLLTIGGTGNAEVRFTSGLISIAGTASSGAAVRLAEDTDNGTNYVAVIAPATLGGDRTVTLPAESLTFPAANASGVLTNNGTGTLSWTAQSTDFADNVFRVSDDGDATKKIAFEASGITGGQVSVLTIQDVDGTVYVTGGQDVSVTDGGTGVSTFGGTNTLLYTTAADTLASLATANNGVLITSGAGAPSISSTLPAAVQGNITDTGTLGDLAVTGNVTVDTNTLFVDATGNRVGIGTVTPSALSVLNVHAATGAARIVVDSEDDAAAIALFADTGVTNKIATITMSDTGVLTIGAGDTGQISIDGVAAGPSSIAFSEDSDIGSDKLTLIAPASLGAARTITFPDATGTLALTSDLSSLNADNITSGTLVLARGGTNKSLTADNGGIVYTDADSMEILAATATAGQILRSGSNAAPSWSTATFPATTTINQLLYSSAANTVTGLATANNALLVTNGSGVPSLSTTLPSGLTAGGLSLTDTLSVSGTIDIQTNAGEALTITADSTGALNLDTGTTGAINIGTGASAKTITIGNTTGATAVNVNAGTGRVNFDTDTLVVDAANNKVGIGTSAPNKRLEVAVAATTEAPSLATDGIYVSNTGSSAVVLRDITNDAEALMFTSSSGTVFGSQTNHSTRLRVGNDDTKSVFIDTDGEVGIGTITPSEKLNVHITSDTVHPGLSFTRTRTTGGTTSSGDILGLMKGQGTNTSTLINAAAIYFTQDGTSTSTSDMPGRIQFLTTPDGSNTLTERMRIDSAGNVGIGTSTPGTFLHVANGSGEVFRTTNTAGAGFYVEHATSASTSNVRLATLGTGNMILRTGVDAVTIANGTGVVTIADLGAGNANSNGYVCAVATTGLLVRSSDGCDIASDERLKTNIVAAPEKLDVLDAVEKLNGVYFDWKTGMKEISKEKQGTHDFGLIAQDVQSVIPELVSQADNGYLGVRYDRLVALLIEVDKAQNKQIKGIQGDVAEIKKITEGLSDVKAKVDSLSNEVLKIASIEGKISTLEDKVEKHDKDIEELKSEVKKLRREVKKK